MTQHQTAQITTIKAAAGTGKTFRLTLEYLRRIGEGPTVDRVIAITFTRRAAAELIARVSGTLHRLLDPSSPQAQRAEREVDDGLLEEAREIPGLTPDRIRAALAGLSSAPIGTIDSFVQRLLAEYALHARLPIGDGRHVALDLTGAAGGDPGPFITEAARHLVSPATGALDQRVEALLRGWTVAELVSLLGRRQRHRGVRLASFDMVFGAIAAQLVQQAAARLGEGQVRTSIASALGLVRPRDAWAAIIQQHLASGPAKAHPTAGVELASWLTRDKLGPAPSALAVLLYGSKASAERYVAGVPRPDPADEGELLPSLALSLGWDDVRSGLSAALGLTGELDGDTARVKKLVNTKGKSVAGEVVRWLLEGGAAPAAAEDLLRDLSASGKKKAPIKPVVAAIEAFSQDGSRVLARLQGTQGVEDPRGWILDTLDVCPLPERWGELLRAKINNPSKPAATAVAAWLASGDDASPPPELVFMLGALEKDSAERVLDACFGVTTPSQVAAELVVEGSTVQVPLDKIVHKELEAFLQPAARDTAERLRSALDSLCDEVSRAGMREAARAGELGYDDLLEVAIALCGAGPRGEPSPLQGRFDALLVDEVQDSSPTQLRFYLSLLATTAGMKATFVGDSRQSIYLFRGAAPAGLARLAEGAATEELPVNYRSVPDLVAAQRELFGERLTRVLEVERLQGLDSLEELSSSRGDPSGATPLTIITPAAGAQTEGDALPPDQVTRGVADLLALAAFAEEVEVAWSAAGDRGQVDAAVICPTWSKAREARDLLASLLGRPDAAFVDSGSGWFTGRVVKDLRIILAALLDPRDQMAWLGLWKHPMVGLSDQAFARVRRGEGVFSRCADGGLERAEPWTSHLGWVLEADALGEPHLRADQRAFARALGPLRAARDQLGRRPLADVLDELARRLRWRVVLAAGPDPDAVAQLEVALEWVRTMDQEGRSPVEVLDRFSAGADGQDLPRLELHRPPQHVSCLTVFQAKGLKYDHVCVLSPGVAPPGGGGGGGAGGGGVGGGPGPPPPPQPLRFDPLGAFAAGTDPIGRLCSAIAARRRLEEDVRLAYVAITRAARSVVLGLPERGSDGAQELLRLAWAAPEGGEGQERLPSIPGVLHRPVRPLPDVKRPPTGVVTPRADATLPVVDPAPAAWIRQSPSHLSQVMPGLGLSASAVGRAAAAAVLTEGGYQPPLYGPLEPPVGTAEQDESHWGTLVHAWFASWGFDGTPSLEAAGSMLCQDMRIEDPALAAWLVQVAEAVANHPDTHLWRLVTKPGVQLHFELPLLGVARLGATAGDPLLLAGRTDLLIRDPSAPPDSRWTVVDFKAGSKTPSYASGDPACPDLADHLFHTASLRSYAPQLEAYREALDSALAAAGCFGVDDERERVGSVALWFVRSGAGMWW